MRKLTIITGLLIALAAGCRAAPGHSLAGKWVLSQVGVNGRWVKPSFDDQVTFNADGTGTAVVSRRGRAPQSFPITWSAKGRDISWVQKGDPGHPIQATLSPDGKTLRVDGATFKAEYTRAAG